MSDAFISYSRQDGAFASRVQGALETSGCEVWVDTRGIPPTAEWLKEIFAAIQNAHVFVAILSPDWVTSEICRLELEHAVQLNKRLLPILHRSVDPALIPETLKIRQWIAIPGEDQIGAQTDAIVSAIRTDLDWVRAHTRLLVRATEWRDRGRDESLTLRSKDLAEAERTLDRPNLDPQLTDVQRWFIHESRASAKRRTRRLWLGAALAAALLVIAGVVALRQSGVAQRRLLITRSQVLAAHADRLLPERLDHALLLAAAAWKTAPTSEAEGAMLAALQKSPHLDRYWFCPRFELSGTAISSDGQLIGTLIPDGGVEIRPVADPRKAKLVLKTPHRTADLLFSTDARHVITSYYSEGFGVWDTANGALVAQYSADRYRGFVGHAIDSEGRLAVWSPEGAMLWSLHEHKFVAGPMPSPLGDVHHTGYNSAGERVEGWSKEPVQIRAAAFSPDGDLLAIGYENGEIVLWNTRTGKAAGPPIRGHTSWVTALSFSRDGRVLASADHEKYEIKFWDVDTRQLIGKPLEKHEDDIQVLAFSRDGQSLASGDFHGNIYIWSLKEGYAAAYTDDALTGHHSPIEAIVWETADKALISAGTNGSIIRWNREFGNWPLLPGYAAGLAVSRDGKYIASGGNDVVTVWDTASRQVLRRVPTEVGEVVALAFSPDGSRLAVAGRQASVELWEIATGIRVGRQRQAHEGEVADVTYSRDGRTIISSGKDTVIRMWTASDLSAIGEFTDAHQFEVLHLAASPKANVLASSGRNGSVRLWDLQSRTRQGKDINAVGDVTELAFSPDGSRLFTAGDRGKIEIWDTATQNRVYGPLDGKAFIGSVGVSANGKLLATGNGDGSVTIWDLETLTPRQQPLKMHDSIIETVLFDPRETYIAASAHAGVAMLDLRPDNWLAAICGKVRRNLSAEEWRQLEPTQAPIQTCPEEGASSEPLRNEEKHSWFGLATLFGRSRVADRSVLPPSNAAFDKVNLSATLLSNPMTRAKALEVLNSVPPDTLARLRQYMYVADLHDASGSESSPDALINRLQSEFSDPIAITRQQFTDMMQEVRSIDATFPKLDKPDEFYGWNKVAAMLDPVYARIPSMDAAFAEIFKAPKPLRATFLIDQYFADHYHNYRMKQRILDFLGTADFGKAPLPIFEELLATTGPDEPGTVTGVDYRHAVTAGRAILGDAFPAWYRSVRGIGYEDEMSAWYRKQSAHTKK